MPKFNLYQSLHTTVIGPGGKPVEIQIRTYDMHERAEHGVAAHWKYKQNPNATSGDSDRMSSEEQANWLRALVEMERETGDPEEFLDSLRYEIAGDEVYVFTPKGEVIVLPARATPVDFAYAVHTEVGHHTVGAKVNGRLVALDTPLESGETVEVVTSKSDKAGPSRDWLAFVASPRARSKIKAWFSKERREEAVESGKEALARAMRKQNLPLQRLMNHESILSVATSFGYPDVSGLYAAVGEGHISAQNVVNRLVDNLGGGDGTEETLSEGVTPGSQKPRSEASGDSAITVSGSEPERDLGQARQVLYACSRRCDRRLHYARPGRIGAPLHVRERGAPEPAAARALRGRVVELRGAQRAVPRPDRGACTRPWWTPLGSDPGPV